MYGVHKGSVNGGTGKLAMGMTELRTPERRAGITEEALNIEQEAVRNKQRRDGKWMEQAIGLIFVDLQHPGSKAVSACSALIHMHISSRPFGCQELKAPLPTLIWQSRTHACPCPLTTHQKAPCLMEPIPCQRTASAYLCKLEVVWGQTLGLHVPADRNVIRWVAGGR